VQFPCEHKYTKKPGYLQLKALVSCLGDDNFSAIPFTCFQLVTFVVMASNSTPSGIITLSLWKKLYVFVDPFIKSLILNNILEIEPYVLLK
jgi:hypothetical protein